MQIYFLHDNLQTNHCMKIFTDFQHNIVNNIQEELELVNALIFDFKSSRDILGGGHNLRLCISGEVLIGEHRH